jgi:hypothetical protein
VQRAEQFILDRFVRMLPAAIKAPVVHIIKVCGWRGWLMLGRLNTSIKGWHTN